MRLDSDIISAWIEPHARVLDLGCGDGSLLRDLSDSKQVQGYGLEIDPARIRLCVSKGINVIEQDIDRGLGNFQTDSFETVVMTQTLQAVRYPHLVLDEMLRVGHECIITFPNFGYWRCRAYLALRGRMPVATFMPHAWYDTPNIHFCTVLDFEALCRQKNIQIVDRVMLDQHNRHSLFARMLPNLFAVTAIYRVTK